MEPIISFFIFLILLGCLFLLGAALYKSRGDISNWLNTKAAAPNRTHRKVLLKRQLEDAQVEAERRQEDIERQLANIEEKEKAETEIGKG